ncbi:Hypothetical_protein [Hexamita inflata]|uniref:Hypothetical_protein n=1 Tax=Hexamita inflata TaxID=28002 RepID=A0AA86UMT9_9EUKA|nr:Hypothetical protein HINF_LOCUS45151 [Hexamita inflata]
MNLERVLSRAQYKILVVFFISFHQVDIIINDSSTVNTLKLNHLINVRPCKQQMGTPNIAFTEIQYITTQLWRRPTSAVHYILTRICSMIFCRVFRPRIMRCIQVIHWISCGAHYLTFAGNTGNRETFAEFDI